MKNIVLIFILLQTITTYSIESAKLKCLNVDNLGGGVNLFWEISNDASIFQNYEIYYSNNHNGPYNLITTINNRLSNNYYHPTASADVNNCYYYIKTIGTADFSISDTLQTIKLSITNTNDGGAILAWNAPSNPLPFANNWYYIYREYPTNNWILLDSTQNLQYTDDFPFCEAQINYYILLNGTFCNNKSSLQGGLFKDITPPDTPILDSVSINITNEQIEIGWQKTLANDTKGYLIYHFQGNIWVQIAAIDGKNNTFFTGINTDLKITPQSYRIVAIDSCNNASPLGVLQHTIKLNNQIDVCNKKVNLLWNTYSNMAGGVLKYKIFLSINNSEYNLIGETNNDNYTYSGLNNSSVYKFFVRAEGNLSSSTSSISQFTFQQSQIPTFLYFRYASVNIEQDVEIAVFTDNSVDFNSLNIYRKDINNANYNLIKSFDKNAIGEYTFVDNSVNTNENTYQYYATIKDVCNFENIRSDTINTIFLQGNSNENATNRINWNHYKKFDTDIENYTIYRSFSYSNIFTPITSVSNLDINFEEEVLDISEQGADFYYYIEAIESNGNKYGFKDFARSNITKITQTSTTYIPNAFSPNGKNPIFKPVNVFVNSSTYIFSIYSRTGELLFQTHNPNEGWDGKIKGILAPQGVYVYHLVYDPNGAPIKKSGVVTLLN